MNEDEGGYRTVIAKVGDNRNVTFVVQHTQECETIVVQWNLQSKRCY